MVLRGRDSAPAAALSGSLFLKPPALPEDTYWVAAVSAATADLQSVTLPLQAGIPRHLPTKCCLALECARFDSASLARTGYNTNILVETESKIRRVAFLGDYLPRKCGIATFTTDLLTAVAAEHPQCQCFAVPVNDIEGGYEYPDVVRFEIEEQDLTSYQRAADFINISNVDIVCVQHEFGIYGGPAGSHVLALVRELKMPVVTTLHTLLREPNDDQRRVMQELIARSTRLVVMTERGQQMLQEVYQAPAGQDRSHPAWHSRHTVCRSELLQGPVWRGRKGCVAHVRAAFAEQGN